MVWNGDYREDLQRVLVLDPRTGTVLRKLKGLVGKGKDTADLDGDYLSPCYLRGPLFFSHSGTYVAARTLMGNLRNELLIVDWEHWRLLRRLRINGTKGVTLRKPEVLAIVDSSTSQVPGSNRGVHIWTWDGAHVAGVQTPEGYEPYLVTVAADESALALFSRKGGGDRTRRSLLIEKEQQDLMVQMFSVGTCQEIGRQHLRAFGEVRAMSIARDGRIRIVGAKQHVVNGIIRCRLTFGIGQLLSVATPVPVAVGLTRGLSPVPQGHVPISIDTDSRPGIHVLKRGNDLHCEISLQDREGLLWLWLLERWPPDGAHKAHALALFPQWQRNIPRLFAGSYSNVLSALRSTVPPAATDIPLLPGEQSSTTGRIAITPAFWGQLDGGIIRSASKVEQARHFTDGGCPGKAWACLCDALATWPRRLDLACELARIEESCGVQGETLPTDGLRECLKHLGQHAAAFAATQERFLVQRSKGSLAGGVGELDSVEEELRAVAGALLRVTETLNRLAAKYNVVVEVPQTQDPLNAPPSWRQSVVECKNPTQQLEMAMVIPIIQRIIKVAARKYGGTGDAAFKAEASRVHDTVKTALDLFFTKMGGSQETLSRGGRVDRWDEFISVAVGAAGIDIEEVRLGRELPFK